MDGTEAGTHPGELLRTARAHRGWSQTEAARRLADLVGATARPGSLKTQLSRWENGHATPAPEHRALLAELYGTSAAELGLEPRPAGPDTGGADRLRGALARAAALDPAGTALLREQLRATAALDHRLGTAAAHATLAAQVGALRELLVHCVDPGTETELAALLAGAALLLGDQERDRDAPEDAWRAYALAADAARRAGRADLLAPAIRHRDRLLWELDPGAGPPVRVERYAPPAEVWAEFGHHDDSVRDRTEEALSQALVADRAGHTAEARAAAARARELALRTGSVRTLAHLAALGTRNTGTTRVQPTTPAR